MRVRTASPVRSLPRKVRVLIVDDSSYNRQLLTEHLSARESLEVVGAARNGEDALKKALQLKPDIVTLDLEMPIMDGFTFLRIVMQSNPVPVIVVSSRKEDRSVFRALELGAVDFIGKPEAKKASSVTSIIDELIYKIENIAEVRMEKVRFPGAELRVPRRVPPGVAVPRFPEPPPVRVRAPAGRAERMGPVELVVIGASTGGPSAIQQVLQNWPPEITAPVVIAQHMPPGFTRHFAERLGRLTGMDVAEGTDGETLRPGSFRVAPGGSDILVHRAGARGYRTEIAAPEGSQGFVPNVDRLFLSAARICAGGRAAGIVLTGMGNDGAKGAAALHDAGSPVIAESETTAVVYGMPREAARTGKTDAVVPLDQIPAALRALAIPGRPKSSE